MLNARANYDLIAEIFEPSLDEGLTHLPRDCPTNGVRVLEQRISIELMEWNLEVKLLGQAMHAAAVLEAAATDEARKASDQLTLALAAVTEDCPGSGAVWRERQVEARLKLQIYRRHRELLGETLEHSKAALARTEQRLLREMERSESGTMIGTDYGEA
jgi:hypothetical protein